MISNKPVRSNDLWLNLMLKTPISDAETNAMAECDVLICPRMPTGALNVLPMSIRRRAAKTAIGPDAKLAITSECRNSLPENSLVSRARALDGIDN